MLIPEIASFSFEPKDPLPMLDLPAYFLLHFIEDTRRELGMPIVVSQIRFSLVLFYMNCEMTLSLFFTAWPRPRLISLLLSFLLFLPFPPFPLFSPFFSSFFRPSLLKQQIVLGSLCYQSNSN